MSNRNATVENALVFFLLAFAVMAKTVFSQNCQSTGCPGLKECCSSWGSCGIKDDQCGFWCFSGLCNLKNKSYGFNYNVSAGPRGPIESIVTPSLFKRIMSKVGNNCPAKGFYTHQAFISAVKSFQAYKGTVAKREIAAILTHFAHGSKGFCYKEDKARGRYCSPSKKYPCEPGKQYYGRGPLQSIRWNEYYGAAGIFLRLPMLKDPDMVAHSPEVAFKLALWFWTTNVRPALYLGFGETSKRVDGRLCDNLHPDDTKNLVKQYVDLCKILGVTPDEDDLSSATSKEAKFSVNDSGTCINHVQRLSWSTDQAFKFHVEDLFWSNSPPNTHASEEKMIIEHPRILEIVAVDLQR
ncbi:hypothetical protein YC2023_028703 [Brassica napus]